MKRVYPLSVVAVLVVMFLLIHFNGTNARQGHSSVQCQINAWNWRSTPRNGLGGWMDEIGHNHIGHGKY